MSDPINDDITRPVCAGANARVVLDRGKQQQTEAAVTARQIRQLFFCACYDYPGDRRVIPRRLRNESDGKADFVHKCLRNAERKYS